MSINSVSTAPALSSGASTALLAGRVLLSILFILAGFAKLTAISGTAGWFGSLGLPGLAAAEPPHGGTGCPTRLRGQTLDRGGHLGQRRIRRLRGPGDHALFGLRLPLRRFPRILGHPLSPLPSHGGDPMPFAPLPCGCGQHGPLERDEAEPRRARLLAGGTHTTRPPDPRSLRRSLVRLRLRSPRSIRRVPCATAWRLRRGRGGAPAARFARWSLTQIGRLVPPDGG